MYNIEHYKEESCGQTVYECWNIRHGTVIVCECEDEEMADHVFIKLNIHDKLVKALEDLLSNSSQYSSAIELDFGFDGDKWVEKALETLAAAKGE